MSETTLRENAADAGLLLRFALNPKMRPSRNEEYSRLVLRYQTDPVFASAVDAVAGGQGLSVLTCDRIEGMVLAPLEDSPFRIRLADYVPISSADIRLLHGLVQLAIAATAYPTAAALEDSGHVVSVSALQVYDRVRRLVEETREGNPDTDPPEDAPELEPVWRLLGRLRAADTTPDGRETSYNILGAIRRALHWLEEKGLAEPVAGVDDTWRLRERYRLQVLAAASETVDALRSRLPEGEPAH